MLAEVKPVVFETLERMYKESFDSKNETDLHRNPVNTEKERKELRELIMITVNNLLQDEDITNLLDAMESLINDAGYKTGCFISDHYTTGPWSVRLSDIAVMRAMIKFSPPCAIANYEGKNGYTFTLPYGDNDRVKVQVTGIRYTAYCVIYELRPFLYTEGDKLCIMNPFEDCPSWSTLYYHPHTLPWFMTIEY